ncbi:MAG: ABC transporter permease [Methanomicrobiaceae archaeon]|uniref:Abc transporter, permease protein n=1 Tax=hydrocarbon metagenome TaxID=938273 RepID=A0A0W8FEM8_9ZZZZ|nr:ABC transporter permease [Methanomicrobiaceae archaeon]MDD5418990.1 ABC transporter permease [Methanomicrobiaceae archaeon]
MKGVLTYIHRDFIRWIRYRVGVISALVLPAAWLLFVGLALPVQFTGNYLDFITPGILVMTILTTGISSGSLLMFDKILGYLNKFLAMPVPRESILISKILFITVRGILQTTIILILAVLIGATMLHPVQYGLTYLILFLFGVFISAFSTTVALYLDDHDSFAAFTAMITMPLFFTSSALMPYDVMPGWLRVAARVNPLSFAIDAIRDVGAGTIPVLPITMLTLFAAVIVVISGYVFRKVTV